MQFIVRQKYLDELIELYGTPDIKVITGIRRSGKSVLLQEFITYLQSLEEKSNIVMINLQELEFDHLLEYHALHKYILGQYKEGMNNILLIDEVQMCPQFELAINSIYTKGIYDLCYRFKCIFVKFRFGNTFYWKNDGNKGISFFFCGISDLLWNYGWV